MAGASTSPESGPATIVHGDYRLGNVMFAPGAPARLNAIFDWELATIGDPLADVGYLVATWAQPGDPPTRRPRSAASRAQPGFPTRDELIARYEERSGRSMGDVRWYMTLALWKSAIFLEGSYKRAAGGHDRRRVLRPARARACRTSPTARGAPRRANDPRRAARRLRRRADHQRLRVVRRLLRAPRASTPDTVRDRFRTDPAARDLLGELEEGQIGDAEFEARFAADARRRASPTA